jgi:HK97 family phage prohead protease
MTLLAERADTKPYGNVTYADPGYQSDKVKRYPLDSEAHCKAAWSYINMPKNAAKYSPEQVKAIKGRIRAAAKKFGIEISDESKAAAMSIYVAGLPEMQTRFRPGEVFVRAFDFEARSSGDGRTLEGYAAVFNSPTRIADRAGDFDEVILPGAFKRSLEQRTPVLQFEHGRDPRVGAVPIGSIDDIREDGKGLYVRARLYDNPVVEPVRQAIEGRSIKGMSFRFMVPDGGDTWSARKGEPDLREIRDTDTAECGPVVFPAYDTTSVSVRSILAQLDPQEYRALIRELAAELRLAADLTDVGQPGSAEHGWRRTPGREARKRRRVTRSSPPAPRRRRAPCKGNDPLTIEILAELRDKNVD